MTKQNTKLRVQQPRTLDQADLDARIEKIVERYKNSHAACLAVDEPILLLYTKKVVELLADGYSLNEKLPCRSGNHSYSAYFNKPEQLQEEEIEALKLEVEDKLKAEVEAFNAEQESILAEQLYQAQKKKEEEAERKKEEKLREQARKEAADYFASIKEGK